MRETLVNGLIIQMCNVQHGNLLKKVQFCRKYLVGKSRLVARRNPYWWEKQLNANRDFLLFKLLENFADLSTIWKQAKPHFERPNQSNLNKIVSVRL